MSKPHFFVSMRTGKLPVYCTRPVMNYQSLASKEGKTGGLEKCGQDLKVYVCISVPILDKIMCHNHIQST